MDKRERLFWPDFIRTVACLLAITCHFNAAVSKYFTLNKGVCYNFPINIYIGTIGVNLFFMISGAMLMYTKMKLEIKGKKESLLQFYKKRFLAIYPMYWLAFSISLAVSFFVWRGMPKDSPIWFLESILGFSGYLYMLGVTPFAFYQVGEWFLGCIICLYIITPVLLYLVEKIPKTILVSSILAYVLLCKQGVQTNLFFMYIPYLVVGMILIKYCQPLDKTRSILLQIGLALSIICLYKILERWPIYEFLVCVILFAILKELGDMIRNRLVKNACSWIAKYSYAIFLVHHKLITILVLRFDIDSLWKREIWLLFVIYCVLTMFLSKEVFALDKWIRRKFECVMNMIQV